MTQEKPPRIPLLLTVAGLIPFAGLAIALVIEPAGTTPEQMRANTYLVIPLLVYAACILSFLGGIRWGAALLAAPLDATSLSLSVLPTLAAWALVCVAWGLGMITLPCIGLAGLFALQLVWDRQAWRSDKLPAWFGQARWIASVGAIASLLMAAVSF